MIQQNPCVSRCLAALLVASFMAVVTPGCGPAGPDLGQVEGTVTLDGNPLPNANVEFYPEGQRGSGGVTDASGKYRLEFKTDTAGAVLGKHTVRITTLREGGDPDRGDLPDSPELVPAKYNAKSTLEVTVESGDNTLDFSLTTQ